MAQILIRDFEESDLEQVQEIFWETSTRDQFNSIDERFAFQNFYLNSYFSKICLVAESSNQILGYILGSTESSSDELHLKIFEDCYEQFPAHLHINCHESARGLGVGSRLVSALEERLRSLGVKGLHLITASGARNVSFYEKNGFVQRVERIFNGKSLLLLGKTL
ncbi:MAG: GNAT family N-acetyltransferase [Bacteriovoracaceae bacterium]|nr:GNAT family N-acetyltransferase [Bacteriovoracaceae bacterium]